MRREERRKKAEGKEEKRGIKMSLYSAYFQFK